MQMKTDRQTDDECSMLYKYTAEAYPSPIHTAINPDMRREERERGKAGGTDPSFFPSCHLSFVSLSSRLSCRSFSVAAERKGARQPERRTGTAERRQKRTE
mmetsp:Transcript_26292/g.51634  ORF Transcript_26292/g.51634 Transcript_26292/m.51634 type:complete len:101 (+) Transcript_26292:97-399(+)